MNTTQIEFWVGITCTVILPLSAFILFLIMDKLNEIKSRIQGLIDSNNSKDAQIALLQSENNNLNAMISELQNQLAGKGDIEEVSTFLAERGF